MTGLLHAHSGLRFLILLFGVANVIALGAGLAMKQPFGKVHRILGASFAGCLHLQVLIGFAMVAMGRWYPQLAGHLAMMFIATTVAQATTTINRKRPVPGFQLPLIGTLVALACIVGGIMAINRGIFTMTVTG